MKRLILALSLLTAVGWQQSVVQAQTPYHALVYGYGAAADVHWLPFANGDSLGTAIYQGHEIPTSDDFPPMSYSCTDTWYQHAGSRMGTYSGTCTMVDDDGDWYRFVFTQPDPDAWEGTQRCLEGTGKYEGITCDGVYYRGTSSSGSGWFRGEKEGTIVLKR